MEEDPDNPDFVPTCNWCGYTHSSFEQGKPLANTCCYQPSKTWVRELLRRDFPLFKALGEMALDLADDREREYYHKISYLLSTDEQVIFNINQYLKVFIPSTYSRAKKLLFQPLKASNIF